MPEIEINELVDQALGTSLPLNEVLYFPKIQLSDNSLGVLKIAVNFYLLQTKDDSYVKNAMNILKSKDENTAKELVSWFHVELSSLNGVAHSIRLIGDKQLYCLVSLFGIENRHVLLNDNYTGEKLDVSYSYDLINECETQQTLKCCEILKQWPNNLQELFSHVFGYIYEDNIKDFMIMCATELSERKDFYSCEQYEHKFEKKCNVDFFRGIKQSMPDFYNAYLYKKANEHCYNITEQMSSNFFDVEDKDALLQILVRGSKEDIIKYILDRFCKDIPNILNDYMHKNEEINEKMMTTANEMANICTQKRSLLGL